MTARDTDELIDALIRVHTDKGRGRCDVVAWLRDQVGREDTLAVRAELIARPDWSPRFSIEGLRDLAARAERSGVADAAAMALYAADVARYPFRSDLRPQVEHLLLEFAAVLGVEALGHLARWMNQHAGHPDPKGFFALPQVRAHLPADLDLNGLRAHPDHGLGKVEIAGDRQVVAVAAGKPGAELVARELVAEAIAGGLAVVVRETLPELVAPAAVPAIVAELAARDAARAAPIEADPADEPVAAPIEPPIDELVEPPIAAEPIEPPIKAPADEPVAELVEPPIAGPVIPEPLAPDPALEVVIVVDERGAGQ